MYVTVTTVTLYCFQKDVVEVYSVKFLRTTVDYFKVAMITDQCRHLTYDSSGAWHTVCAMLLSNYVRGYLKFNETQWKGVCFQTHNSFSNNLIPC